MKKIINSEDWKWYKNALDVAGRYDFKHVDAPEKYPCIVSSDHWDDPNGPYTYFHTFYYQEEHVCSECGHKTSQFPVPKEEIEE